LVFIIFILTSAWWFDVFWTRAWYWRL